MVADSELDDWALLFAQRGFSRDADEVTDSLSLKTRLCDRSQRESSQLLIPSSKTRRSHSSEQRKTLAEQGLTRRGSDKVEDKIESRKEIEN